jgi:sec-independent protein translocase protein TatA
MFGKLGAGELALILAIALVVVGPSRLPELGKSIGKTMNEFRKFSKDVKEDLSLDEKTTKYEKKKEEEEEEKKED